MLSYIVRRALLSIPVVLSVTVVIFVLINFAPGDPVTAMLFNPQSSMSSSVMESAIDQQREKYGLNQPIYVRYFRWLKNIFRGNLGVSITKAKPVTELLKNKILLTLQLTVTAIIISIIFGTVIGALSAVYRYTLLDYTATIFAYTFVSTPNFFAALLAIYFFALKLGILPPGGTKSLGQSAGTLDHLWHLILPATVLGLRLISSLVRYTRSSLVEVLDKDFITTARAKGLSGFWVVVKHGMRNALLPVITLLGLRIPFLFGGSVIIEKVFAWPGMGLLTFTSVIDRDYPTLMAINLILAILVVSANLVTDVLYAYIDPRIRYS